MSRVEAFERLRVALDSTHGDEKYEETISQAENAFVAGDYARMSELLETLNAQR